jgi:sarcosine oxidase subunit alpha
VIATAEVVVVGGGPAGLSAALAVTGQGLNCLVVDRQHVLGGQLIKQTHRFFGSRAERAGHRGIDIGEQLAAELLARPGAEAWLDATAAGYYTEDRTLLVERKDGLRLVRAGAMILATGASERALAFPGNDLPGVYGAGAVQTLMNVYGVRPGRRAVMVGAGNIGLIVGYQLIQAGVEVAAVLEAAPSVGGYWVHAAKLARAGVPIMTSHSVRAAEGQSQVEAVAAVELDRDWRPVPGTDFRIECDLVCLAVGLSPLVELATLAGCELAYISELGGYVPWHDEEMRTTVPGIWVAGDAAGVEEASSAMIEGTLAGLAVANHLRPWPGYADLRDAARKQLSGLRAGPTAAKIRSGLAKLKAVRPSKLAAAGGDGQ